MSLSCPLVPSYPATSSDIPRKRFFKVNDVRQQLLPYQSRMLAALRIAGRAKKLSLFYFCVLLPIFIALIPLSLVWVYKDSHSILNYKTKTTKNQFPETFEPMRRQLRVLVVMGKAEFRVNHFVENQVKLY